jgi:hypothetical protein
VQGVLSGIKDGKVHALLSARAETIAHQQMFAVGKRKIERRADASIAQIPEQQRNALNMISIAQGDDEVDQITTDFIVSVRGNPHLNDVEAERIVANFRKEKDLERISAMLDGSSRDLILLDRELNAGRERFPGLGGREIAAAKNSLDAELKRRATAADAASARTIRSQASNLSDRILLGAAHPLGPTSEVEIIRTIDDGPVQEHLVKLFREEAEGRDMGRPDWVMINDLNRRVRAGELDNEQEFFMEVFEKIGHGVPAAEASKLATIWNARQDPVQRLVENRKKEFLDTAEDMIVDVVFGLKNDPIGSERYAEFRDAFREEYDRRVAEGINPMELLRFTGPNSLAPLIADYQIGVEEQMEELSRASERKRETAEARRLRREAGMPEKSPEKFLEDEGL